MEHQITFNFSDARNKKITADIPNATTVFAKQLQKTDRSHQCSIPTSALVKFPVPESACKRKFNAFDKNGNEWQFKLAVRQGPYKKRIIEKSKWHEFVKAHHLDREDDKNYAVVFYRLHDRPDRLEVRVFNLVSVFNKPMWTEV